MVYFDNAATSWPKPDSVYKAVDNCLRNIGANPGRSGHKMSIEAGRVVYNARDAIAELFNVDDPARIALGFNATDGLNVGIKCLLDPGDHVITSSMEHNSVMRPLRYLLEARKIELTVIKCDKTGYLDPAEIETNIRPNTKLVVINHASNVVGTIQPIDKIGEIVSRHEGMYFMIDAAQSAGVIPIDVEKSKIDMIGFAGHKGMLGPQGTGGIYICEGLENKLHALKQGGTGSDSELEIHPDFLPDKFESGTKNTPGLAGVVAGLEFIQKTGIEKIHQHEMNLTERLTRGLEGIDEVVIYGPRDPQKQTAVVSFNILGMEPSDVSYSMDHDYEIMTRVGLHCAPSAHKTIGSAPKGTIRLSMGYFSTEKEVDYTLNSIKKIIVSNGNG
jgi:cysteine desulfurase family protein